jgi:hypothetical protein
MKKIKQITFNPNLKLAIEPELDTITESVFNRFTIGKKDDSIKGAVYFKPDQVIPKLLILIFKEEEGFIIDNTKLQEDLKNE